MPEEGRWHPIAVWGRLIAAPIFVSHYMGLWLAAGADE